MAHLLAPQPTQTDSLGHESIAARLFEILDGVEDGGAVALCGPWGRGKTDILSRIHKLAQSEDSTFGQIFWLNPWRLETADFLTPIVLSILEQSRDHPSRDRIVKVSIEIYKTATAMAEVFNPAVSAAMKSFGSLASALRSLTKDEESTDNLPPPDPAVALSGQFKSLIDIAFPDKRVLICVDDLDRCLPNRQVSLLEAAHFLSIASPRIVTLVAVDSQQVSYAIESRYGSAEIDADAYLSKLFTLRYHLPALRKEPIDTIMDFHLNRPIPRHGELDHDVESMTMRDWLTRICKIESNTQLFNHFSSGFSAIGVQTPRNIARSFDRLRNATPTNLEFKGVLITSYPECFLFVWWLANTTRWPAIRPILAGKLTDTVRDAYRRPPPQSLAKVLQDLKLVPESTLRDGFGASLDQLEQAIFAGNMEGHEYLFKWNNMSQTLACIDRAFETVLL